MSIAEAFERLRSAAEDGRLERVCRARGVRLLTVFGSAVRDATRARDLDVVVSLAPDADLLGLVGDLVDLTGTDLVDVMVLNGASPTARRNGLGAAVPLYEVDAGLFARTQMAAALEFYETAWMRRLDLERMAAG
jgi:predicted nucleotidyltransferase